MPMSDCFMEFTIPPLALPGLKCWGFMVLGLLASIPSLGQFLPACCAGAARASPAMYPRGFPAGINQKTLKGSCINAKDAEDARDKDANLIMNHV